MPSADSAEFLGRVRARQAFNATDVAIAAEIQQELEALRRAANIAPVAPRVEMLAEYEQVDAEPESAAAPDGCRT